MKVSQKLGQVGSPPTVTQLLNMSKERERDREKYRERGLRKDVWEGKNESGSGFARIRI